MKVLVLNYLNTSGTINERLKITACHRNDGYGKRTYFTNEPTIAEIALTESPFFTKKIKEDHPLWGIKNDKSGIFLVHTDPENWMIVHKFMAPAFTPNAIRHYTPLMQDTNEQAFPVFDELESHGEAFNADRYMLKRLGNSCFWKTLVISRALTLLFIES